MARGLPLVLRDRVAAWPAVAWSRQSSTEFARRLAGLGSGADVDALVMAPEVDGCIGCKADLSDFNYDHYRGSVTEGLCRLAHEAQQLWPCGVAIQSAPIATYLPAFAGTHPLPLLDPAATPRLWVGNGSPRRRISTSSTTSPA